MRGERSKWNKLARVRCLQYARTDPGRVRILRTYPLREALDFDLFNDE